MFRVWSCNPQFSFTYLVGSWFRLWGLGFTVQGLGFRDTLLSELKNWIAAMAYTVQNPKPYTTPEGLVLGLTRGPFVPTKSRRWLDDFATTDLAQRRDAIPENPIPLD